ncbi:hypothetical protein ED562_01640 [Microcystis aeruginosa FACHB-524]|nr:hypothetical protein ED562_01640 [Microcystis aeruginosa FACHB-524]
MAIAKLLFIGPRPVGAKHSGIRDLRFDNVPFGRTQFAPRLWTKSVTVGAQRTCALRALRFADHPN